MMKTTGYKLKKKHRALTDSAGRTMRKLRVSLTDQCNFRCLYCLPQNAQFHPASERLQAQEYCGIISPLIDMGIEEIRITGGEPTLHPQFREIIDCIAKCEPQKLSLTTNGQLLEQHLVFLKTRKVNHLNISLDSLDAGKFHRITQGGDFDRVFHSIVQARNLHFHLKINVVLMRGINTDEILDFVHWSAKTGIEIRFLEYMNIGHAPLNHDSLFFSQAETLDLIQKHHALFPVASSPDSTAKHYTTLAGAKLGFISSETDAFCSSCSRLRLSSTGKLHGCLFNEEGFSLRNLKGKELIKGVKQAVATKPTSRKPYTNTPMNYLGG